MITIYIDGVDSKKMAEMFMWCEEHFGEFRDQWNYYIMDGHWQFRKSEDATIFSLRWT